MTIDEFLDKVVPEIGDQDQRFVTFRSMAGTYSVLYRRAIDEVKLMVDHAKPFSLLQMLRHNDHIQEAAAQGFVADRVVEHLKITLSGEDKLYYPDLVSQSCDPDEVAKMLHDRLVREALWCDDIQVVKAFRVFICNLTSDD